MKAEINTRGYRLIRGDKILFSGCHVRYSTNAPYCAIYEDYPAMETRIQICAATTETSPAACRLINLNREDGDKTIGYFQPIQIVKSQKAADALLAANIKGNVLLKSIFSETTD